ncbi:hypothetical protein O181_078567 [Austropuccinia psidii MF-1]|uniref:Uncharacterized protein n=1 Tax=Austropuccinia psidii MF-1 TaxID=1389203 RepID=A0A9Q3FI29_9BASI|nr:hypothetical protein [Austropuccinia psidii MF-1]
MPTLTHELASASLPNPLQPLTSLHSHTTFKICLCGSAPISALTHPQNILLIPAPHLCTPRLVFSAAYNPYAHAPTAPSIYPSNASTSSLYPPPYASAPCLVFSSAYNPYPQVVPS